VRRIRPFVGEIDAAAFIAIVAIMVTLALMTAG
jgi:hypothetical protein